MKKQLIKFSTYLSVALISFLLIFKTALVVDLLFKSIGVFIIILLIINVTLFLRKR